MNKKVITLGLFLLFAISLLPNFGQESRKKQSADEAQIRAALESTAIGWNEGSLECSAKKRRS
jgi:hypothetical protein